MAITFNKREKEKNKQKKKLDKQKRKEERKANAGSKTFEDMIAYVDENGVITDTPVDLTQVEEIDASLIDVSVPKKEEVEDVPLQGHVEFFNSDKGFGFIKDTMSGEKFFFHISNAPENISEGNRVQYELERGPKGMNAVNISMVK